jgi:hypothetical protein
MWQASYPTAVGPWFAFPASRVPAPSQASWSRS